MPTLPAEDSVFAFPCEFPIKVMGKTSAEFDMMVASLVRKHCPGLGEGAVSSRLSRGGRYMAVTVTIVAESRAQLDAIYHELTGHELVLVAL